MYQCLGCGSEMEGGTEVLTIHERIAATPFDWHLRADGMRAGFTTAIVEKDEEWWRAYTEHIHSEKWRAIRRLVMERAQKLCEGCRVNAAVHVHHMTYDRLGDEMLFDLVALCRCCHQKMHPDKEIK